MPAYAMSRSKVVAKLANPKSSRATKAQAVEILTNMKVPPKPSKETKKKEKDAKKKYIVSSI